MLVDREAAARDYLARPDVQDPIAAAAKEAFDNRLRFIAIMTVPDEVKEHLADKAEASVVAQMRQIMALAAQAHRDQGEAAADSLLEKALPLLRRPFTPPARVAHG